MSRKWIVWKVLASLILVGLLVAGGFAVYYAGWTRGHNADQLAEGEEAEAPSYLPEGFVHPAWRLAMHHRSFGVAGLVFRVILTCLFFIVVCKLIRFVIWGPRWGFAMMGPWSGPHWGPRASRAYRRYARWHHMHGPCGWWDWDGPSDEEGKEADDEPDAGK